MDFLFSMLLKYIEEMEMMFYCKYIKSHLENRPSTDWEREFANIMIPSCKLLFLYETFFEYFLIELW